MAQEFTDFVIEQDFSDVQLMTGEFSLPDPGDYVVDVTHLEQKASKAGNSMIVATFTIAEAEAQITEEAKAFAGQKLWGNYSLLPQSQGRLKALMVACGANLSRFVASEILNSRILVTVVHRKGDPTADENGNLREPKVFANVVNERHLLDAEEEVQVRQTVQQPPPPVMKTQGAAKNGAKTQTAARRA